MKSIEFPLNCNGEDVTASIDYDGHLALDGYDREYDEAAQEFGYKPTTCHEIINDWERGWYFRVIAQRYLRFMDPQDIAKAMVAMAEHAGEFVMNGRLPDNAKQTQPRPFWPHGQAIQFLKNYAKTGDEMPATFIEACRNNVHMAGSQFFNAKDIAGSYYSDALSNAMIWLVYPESPTYGLMDFWNFTEFLANSVPYAGAPGINVESEKLWQLRCFIDIATSDVV